MSAIASAFTHSRAEGRAALIPYFMAGYPSEDAFCRLVASSFDVGADIVEVGIPFSDPVADGPAIQRAGQSSLERNITIDRVISMLTSLKLKGNQPVVLMSYLNPILQFGVKRFLASAHTAGVRGLIVPDLVVEEGKSIEADCQSASIDLIYLVAPTSPPERQKLIMKRSRGFVYAVSVLGVTGVRSALPDNLLTRLREVKQMSRLPVAVGFGISSPQAAARAAQVADGIVVGSALIERMNTEQNEHNQVQSVLDLLGQFRSATTLKSTTTDIARK
ncbi:MAG: tryptophan synthase subunit alpha [candidate division Zixibacteria bacterium]|nr:tryptophan synthase subunit alpha [candidate division Zixibacteria bacterium]